MKQLLLYIFISFFACGLLVSCTKQNIEAPLKFEPEPKSEHYYAALRAYKKSDHSLAFGWWGRSGGDAVTSDMAHRYEGLPDSIDLVSLWGGVPKGAKWEEMIAVREKKGTRFLGVSFVDERLVKKLSHLPENDGSDTSFVAKYDKGDSMLVVGFEIMAKNLVKEIEELSLDGWDFDNEPSGLLANERKFYLFIKVLSKYIGRKTNSGNLIVIDGGSQSGMDPEIAEGVDYILNQVYGNFGAGPTHARWQVRYDTRPKGYPIERVLITEDMQAGDADGFPFQHNGVEVGSVLGMAMFNPTQGRKGGFGGYIIESDAAPDNNGKTYSYLRKGIQIQNPAAY